ncbi:hypothetical protein AB205_0106210 [Aquarana catesbeiana]|uniref:Fibrillar collagen NC1 domain-containing protein n=2 Tax=Aquarana catesbeiana TaxID=8400 RepID=A0A2G9S094_AQUCT|nr:hypothetical protein AB205_0106210 [Aquarana catesbeiana]
MNFLHLLSSEAVHTITIHCLNTPVLGGDTPLTFKGWNGHKLEGNKLLERNVILDECKIQDGSWHKTQFTFHTHETNQLPVVEMSRLSPPQIGQHYIENGPVCFL